MSVHIIRHGEKSCEIEGRIITETGSAILLNHNNADHWFPFSTVNSIHRHALVHGNTEPDQLNVDTWILKKKGLL